MTGTAMTGAARSVLAFGIYLLALGSGLLLAPDVMLALFRQPPAQEPWLRVVGVVALVLGLYYVRAAREGVTAFYRWTLGGRLLAALILFALLALQVVPRFVFLLAAVDLAGVVWTWRALRAGN
jgi:hypothetical protein